MKNKIFIILVMILIALPLIYAETEYVKSNVDTELKFTCTLNNAIPSASTEYNITLSYPNGTTLINNKATTPLGNGAFSYNIMFNQTGLHKVLMFCYDGIYSFSGEGYYDVTPNGGPSASNSLMIFIYILFILAVILLFYSFFMILIKLAISETTIFDVIISWGAILLLIITIYLAKEYLISTYVADLGNQLFTITAWSNGVLPMIALAITMIVKSFKGNKPVGPNEIGRFR